MTSLFFLSSIFCSSQSNTKHFRGETINLSSNRICSDQSTKCLDVNTLPLDTLSSITSFLNQEEQNVFKNLSSNRLNHDFILQALETSNFVFPRGQSLHIVRDAYFRKKIEEKYTNSIYPITLTFHQDDASLFESLQVSSFIRCVQTVVFEGPEIKNSMNLQVKLVIEAKRLESETFTENVNIAEIYDINSAFWFLGNKPHSLREVLESETVTTVTGLEFRGNSDSPRNSYANLFIEQSWSVTEGNIN